MYKFILGLIALIVGYFSCFTVLYLLDIEYYYWYSFISGTVFLGVAMPFIIKAKSYNIDYDNKTIFKTFFSKTYWKESVKELRKLKNLVMIAALLALMLLTKLITLPSGFGDLGISFSYIFLAIGSLLYGPVAGILMGFLVDNLEFLLFPQAYPYFIGYSISSLLTGLIYGLLFYKTKLSFFKVFLSRLLINLLINAILGTVWMGIVASYSSFEMYLTRFIFIALPKNLVYLIPQSIILYMIFKALSDVFVRTNLMSLEVKQNIHIF